MDIETKVNIYFNKKHTEFYGLEIFDEHGKMLLKKLDDGEKLASYISCYTFHVSKGERFVGVKSRNGWYDV